MKPFFLRIPIGILFLYSACTSESIAKPEDNTRLKFYQQALPTATVLIAHEIPEMLQRKEDQPNTNYYEIFDAQKKLIGYVRDFMGPVSPKSNCPCNPLNISLVFTPDSQFKTLLSPAPLQKLNHENFNDREFALLLKIIRNPNEKLLATAVVEDVVDAVTGATKKELKDHVVPHAGLSTRRILAVIKDTQRILQRAPLSRDAQKLEALLKKETDPERIAKELLQLLPKLESDEIRSQSYRLLTQAYTASLQKSTTPNLVIEQTLLAKQTLGSAPQELLDTCQWVMEQSQNSAFVEKCLATFNQRYGTDNPMYSRLQGLFLLSKKQDRAALPWLLKASRHFNVTVDPYLHAHMAKTLFTQQKVSEACQISKNVFFEHPLWPEMDTLLGYCLTPEKNDLKNIRSQLYGQMKTHELKQYRKKAQIAATLPVENQQGSDLELRFDDQNKVVVLVFFATWCPHCLQELPRINQFIENSEKLKTKVEVIGVRTAVEREVESFEDFQKRIQPKFQIYHDANLSLAFGKFAKAHNISMGLPTLVVIDSKGFLRFVMKNGDYRDTAQELSWVVDHLLAKTSI